MATIKSYTDLQQSKVLAKILPLESADMWYHGFFNPRRMCKIEYNPPAPYHSVTHQWDCPCWSLAALSEFILPYIADNAGNNYKFYLSKDGLDRWIAYYKSDNVSIHICEESDNMIDVILEMVCWLKNEEYI